MIRIRVHTCEIAQCLNLWPEADSETWRYSPGSGNEVALLIQGGQAAFQTSIQAIYAAEVGAWDTAIAAASAAGLCSKSVLFSLLGNQAQAFLLAAQAARAAVKVCCLSDCMQASPKN